MKLFTFYFNIIIFIETRFFSHITHPDQIGDLYWVHCLGASGKRGRRGGRIIGIGGVEDIRTQPIESTKQGSSGLTETEVASTELALGPLQECCGCVV